MSEDIKKAMDTEEADYRNKAMTLEVIEALEAICLRHKFDLKGLSVDLVDSANSLVSGFKMHDAKKGHIFTLLDSVDKRGVFIENQLANWDKLYKKPENDEK